MIADIDCRSLLPMSTADQDADANPKCLKRSAGQGATGSMESPMALLLSGCRAFAPSQTNRLPSGKVPLGT